MMDLLSIHANSLFNVVCPVTIKPVHRRGISKNTAKSLVL